MESAFPVELNAFFRNLETNSNPWGQGFAKRGDWAAGRSIPTLAEHPQAEILFWVGCSGSFDAEGQTTAVALAGLLAKAGIDFAILGAEEKCCGDSARRLGNEYLFQTLALENLAVFARYNVRSIVTACPHGFNTLKNEYPKLIDRVPELSEAARAGLRSLNVEHHSTFLRRLMAEGRLKITAPAGLDLTFHDPCYLGRHNGILNEPRALLGALNGRPPRELDECREHSFCCGAGGGLMWTEETLGDRINRLRAEAVLRTGVGTVATACPFCQTMLRDALKDKDRADIRVRDIAELLNDSVQ